MDVPSEQNQRSRWSTGRQRFTLRHAVRTADIPLLVLPAADHQSFVSAELPDRSHARLPTIQPGQHPLTQIEFSIRQALQQAIADLLVPGAPG